MIAGPESPCPICRSARSTAVSRTDRKGAPLRTVLCQSCGHVFTNPQPSRNELSAFYAEKYRSAYKQTMQPKLKHVYRAGLRALERFEHLHDALGPQSRILDVGSGGGEFVFLLHRSGHDVQGIEPNAGYAAFSINTYGIDVIGGDVEDVLPNNETFDVVTLHHVLEHLLDPVAVLGRLAGVIAPAGKIVVEVPNVEARYHAPQRLFHFAHLHVFCTDTLRLAGAKAGLSAIDVSLLPHTRHIRAVFQKDAESAIDTANPETAKRIEAFLLKNTAQRDLLTVRPYRRLWANAKRPIKERLALRQLGSSADAKSLLECLYEPVIEKFQIS